MNILHPFLTASISPCLKNRQGQKALFNRSSAQWSARVRLLRHNFLAATRLSCTHENFRIERKVLILSLPVFRQKTNDRLARKDRIALHVSFFVSNLARSYSVTRTRNCALLAHTCSMSRTSWIRSALSDRRDSNCSV